MDDEESSVELRQRGRGSTWNERINGNKLPLETTRSQAKKRKRTPICPDMLALRLPRERRAFKLTRVLTMSGDKEDYQRIRETREICMVGILMLTDGGQGRDIDTKLDKGQKNERLWLKPSGWRGEKSVGECCPLSGMHRSDLIMAPEGPGKFSFGACTAKLDPIDWLETSDGVTEWSGGHGS